MVWDFKVKSSWNKRSDKIFVVNLSCEVATIIIGKEGSPNAADKNCPSSTFHQAANSYYISANNYLVPDLLWTTRNRHEFKLPLVSQFHGVLHYLSEIQKLTHYETNVGSRLLRIRKHQTLPVYENDPVFLCNFHMNSVWTKKFPHETTKFNLDRLRENYIGKPTSK